MPAHAAPSTSLSRRSFLERCAGATGALAVPMILPARLFGAAAPSNMVRVGQIGTGRIAVAHDMPGVIESGLADNIVAVCDLDARRVARGKLEAEKLTTARGTPLPEVRTYRDHRELLERTDIDAIVISTPYHSHAELALAPILAGTDVRAPYGAERLAAARSGDTRR